MNARLLRGVIKFYNNERRLLYMYKYGVKCIAKIDRLPMKNCTCNSFLISALIVDCGYSLEQAYRV